MRASTVWIGSLCPATRPLFFDGRQWIVSKKGEPWRPKAARDAQLGWQCLLSPAKGGQGIRVGSPATTRRSTSGSKLRELTKSISELENS